MPRDGDVVSLHSNYEICWKNYRAFQDTGWIVLKPLTVIVGPNNSGKTSLLSPLLLMGQTMSSREATAPFVTRGPLIDLGLYENIAHKGDISRDQFFGFRYHVHSKPRKATRLGSTPPGGIEVTLSPSGQTNEPTVKTFELKDFYNRSLLTQSRLKNGHYGISSEWIKNLHPRELKAIQQSKPINFLFSSASALRAYQQQDKSEQSVDANFSKPFSRYLTALAYMVDALNEIFINLTYIGPLRDRPRRYYEITNDTPPSVGSHGEHMASVLYRELPAIKKELDEWIARFEFGSELVLKDLSAGQLFSLLFVEPKEQRQTNIADSGFGASQVLPLIVQALTAPKTSLTIAEQPEIHLNPRLQYALADLLVEMANNDRRVVVETHSEHLLLRLRRLVADGKISSRDVALYFVEKSEGVSTIRDISLEENGAISKWPKGFFEDSLRESLALATAQSQRSQKQGPARVGREKS